MEDWSGENESGTQQTGQLCWGRLCFRSAHSCVRRSAHRGGQAASLGPTWPWHPRGRSALQSTGGPPGLSVVQGCVLLQLPLGVSAEVRPGGGGGGASNNSWYRSSGKPAYFSEVPVQCWPLGSTGIWEAREREAPLFPLLHLSD